MLDWERSRYWSALHEGEKEIMGRPVKFYTHVAGVLNCPSGRLIIKDSSGFSLSGNRCVRIIPGDYHVIATLAKVDIGHFLAYVTVVLSNETPVKLDYVELQRDNELGNEKFKDNPRQGFINRSGFAMLVDEELLAKYVPPDDDMAQSLVYYWQNQINDQRSEWDGVMLDLPKANKGENLVSIKTGWLKEVTPVIAAYDESEFMTHIHVDLRRWG